MDRNAALFKMLIEMASLKHLEEQGKTAKRGYLLVYELYVTISHQIYGLLIVVKVANNYEPTIYNHSF